MVIADYVVNTQLKRKINNIADKIIAKKQITGKDIESIIRLLARMAIYITRKRTYEEVRSFGAGLAISFNRAGELEQIFEEDIMIPIKNIKKLSSELLKKTEQKMREDYGGVEDIKANIKDILNQLAAALRKGEIPRTPLAA